MDQAPLTSAMFSRHYYIQKRYQSKMILKFCLLAAMGTALFCISFYIALDRETNKGYAQALDDLRLIRSDVVKTFLFTEGGAILVLGVAVVVLTLLMSHRIAGPLWRIEQTAKAIGSGNLTFEIRLRKKDEIKPLADKMNNMISGLRTYVEDLSAQYELLDKDIALLKEHAAQGDVPVEELRAIAGDILERSKTLLGSLDEIKTS